MIPFNLWEHQNAIKTLYSKCIGSICAAHNVSRMEIDILLFLANNPCFDTAKDITRIRYLSKSQVSVSIKLLEERGFLKKRYMEGNRKTAHLVISEPASDIISDGRAAQKRFFEIMLKDFAREEMEAMQRFTERIWENIDDYLKEGKSDV